MNKKFAKAASRGCFFLLCALPAVCIAVDVAILCFVFTRRKTGNNTSVTGFCVTRTLAAGFACFFAVILLGDALQRLAGLRTLLCTCIRSSFKFACCCYC